MSSIYRWKESKDIIYDKSILTDQSIQASYHYIDKDLPMFKKSLIKYGISRDLIDRITEGDGNSTDYFKEIISKKYRNLCMDDKYILYKCFAYTQNKYLQCIIDDSTIEVLKTLKWKNVIGLLCGISGYSLLRIIKNKFDDSNEGIYFVKLVKTYGGEYRKL